ITGEKSGISLGMAADAAIVFARTGADGRSKGVSAFVVPLDASGVSRSALRDMGSHAVGRAVLSFDGVRIPASHLIGGEGSGFQQVMRGFDYNRVAIALACLGIAQVSLEERLRDVIGLEIGDGSAEIMKIIVARELMGRETLPY